jgi:diacylglycerol kinase family enzyme
VNESVFAVVNPAAGGGRCGERAPQALAQLQAAGLSLDVATTTAPRHAIALVREAYARGYRRFLAVGGDGTAFDMVNGLFPQSSEFDRPALAFFPLGTGNSFLKDFEYRGVEQTANALVHDRRHSCDVIRLTHAGGEFYFINLLTLGFAADVAALANHRFKKLGTAGYLLAVVASLTRLQRRAFPVRTDGAAEFDRRPCLFLAFNNTRCTGGNMIIAPDANPRDGLIEYVRWGPIGRLGLLRNLPRLFDGSHVNHALASRAAVRGVEFDLEGPVNVTLDGESMRLECQRLEILPGALDIVL